MSKSRLEMKVGLFVFAGLVLLALLLLQFSKGASLFRGSYEIRLHTSDVGGLKKRSSVLMAGVQVGTVSEITLAPDGKSVTVVLAIYKPHVIYKDARFVIEMSGFLGDQYVSIVPTKNQGEVYQPGDDASAEAPFNLQEVARSASGFIQRIDDTARKLNDAIVDVRRLVLNEETLTNLSATAGAMRASSERALGTIGNIDALIATNGLNISRSSSNLLLFSEDLNRFAGTLNSVLATNSEGISAAVKNIETAAATFKGLLDDVNAGKGPAGALLRSEQIATNMAGIVNNLSVTTSNLNRLGLWGILWSKKPPRTNQPPQPVVESPKSSTP